MKPPKRVGEIEKLLGIRLLLLLERLIQVEEQYVQTTETADGAGM